MSYRPVRPLAAEALGTGLLVAAVVGSGIMADALTDDRAVALLANAIPTGAILVVLIAMFGPISGAHLNPAVSLAFALQRRIPPPVAALYMTAQVGGGVAGCLLAHAMFELPAVSTATVMRTGEGQWLAESVATFGLVATILAATRYRIEVLAGLVGLYITAAYWFTASTSFANPAVTIARSLTDTVSGIRPVDVPAFVAAQIVGALVAVAVMGWLLAPCSVRPRVRPVVVGDEADGT